MGGPLQGIIGRKANQDHYLADIPVSKGTMVAIQSIGNHFNEKYFKNPEEFRPERWESECNELPHYAFFAFSGGPRNCIGKQLSLFESKIALIKILKRYKKI